MRNFTIKITPILIEQFIILVLIELKLNDLAGLCGIIFSTL